MTGDTFKLMSLEMETLAVAAFEGSAMLVAVMVTEAGDGRMGGAVYTPSAEMVPSAMEPPEIPETLQLTEVSEALETVATNEMVLPSKTEAVGGVMLTETEGVTGGPGFGLGFVSDAAPAHPTRAVHSNAIAQSRRQSAHSSPESMPRT